MEPAHASAETTPPKHRRAMNAAQIDKVRQIPRPGQ